MVSSSQVFKRECVLLLRTPGSWLQGLLFFALVIFLFSFVLMTRQSEYHLLLPLYIWLAALLAQLLAIDALFKQDHLDGSLDLLLLSETSLGYLVIAKLLPHLLFCLIPLLILTAVLSIIWQFEWPLAGVLLLSLSIGVPSLFLLGAIGAALTVALRSSSVLTGIILLPLYVPVLLFAVSAVQNAALGLPWQGAMALLGANFILVGLLSPITSAAILKVTAG
ncbi:MAG TPA: heme exporter protein CcmB [Gammaproteobacteria bacterium]|nr:heme exporter protein CcmB [Gammaproteobacteria bacterium]